MVGLAGVVAPQKNEVEVKELLSCMCFGIKHVEKQKIEYYINKGIGLGRVHTGIFNPEPQPIFNEDRTICIMMDGEVYDYQDVKNALVSKGHTFTIDNDPEFILHLYEEYGNDFVHKLNGSFSIVIYNERSHELLIVNDRYGLRPIFYANNGDGLLFGSEVKAILQDETFKKIVDDRSVAEFFSFGFILGNKTFFHGIELVPPGSIMTYAGGNVSIEQYWDYEFNGKDSDHPEEYYLEKMSRLILQATDRQSKGEHRLGILLSGGMDSRIIAASISKKISPLYTVTYGKPDCYDLRFAEMIVDKLGTIHNSFEFKPEDIAESAEKVVYITDGMLNVIFAQRQQTYNEISEYIDVVFHGYVGDVLTGSRLRGYTFDLINLKNDFDIFKITSEYLPPDFLKYLFKPEYFSIIEKNLNYSRDYISQLGDKVKSSSDRLLYYNLRERQRRRIVAGFIYARNFMEFRTPFTDYDYMDFMISMPTKFKFEQQLYKKMILTLFPDLRNIPYSGTGLPLYRSRHLINIMDRYKLILNLVTGKAFNIKLFSEKDKHLAAYSEWIRTNKTLKEYILNILTDKRTIERPYFNQKFIRKTLDLHMSGKKDFFMLIGLLLTFELWNRQFIDK